ncbi:unnamed protein product [Brassica rapa subsp. narinosa]
MVASRQRFLRSLELLQNQFGQLGELLDESVSSQTCRVKVHSRKMIANQEF